MKRYLNIIYIILFISIGMIALILAWGVKLEKLGNLIEMSYRFFLITIIGGLVPLIYKEYFIAKQKWEAQKDNLKQLNIELIQSYNEIKGNRRLLRSQSRRELGGVECFLSEPYNKLIIELNKVQLNIELSKRKLKTGFDFLENKVNLIEQLVKMEKYLGNIIEEHEFAFRMYESTPKLLDASKLPLLMEYTDKKMKSKKIREGVFIPFRSALKEINISYEKYVSSKNI